MTPSLADRALQLALEEVLEQMFYLSPDGEAVLPAELPEPWLAAQLRFTGPVAGGLGLAVRPATAALLADNFLGQDCKQRPTAQLADILGELVNMVAGSLLGRVARRPAFDLAPPQPLPLFGSLLGSLLGSPIGCSAGSPHCPSESPSGLQSGPHPAPLSCSQTCSQTCPLSGLCWPEIRLTHEIVRAYAFEGQLFLVWLHCDSKNGEPNSCEQNGSSSHPSGAVHRPAHNAPGLR